MQIVQPFPLKYFRHFFAQYAKAQMFFRLFSVLARNLRACSTVRSSPEYDIAPLYNAVSNSALSIPLISIDTCLTIGRVLNMVKRLIISPLLKFNGRKYRQGEYHKVILNDGIGRQRIFCGMRHNFLLINHDSLTFQFSGTRKRQRVTMRGQSTEVVSLT